MSTSFTSDIIWVIYIGVVLDPVTLQFSPLPLI